MATIHFDKACIEGMCAGDAFIWSEAEGLARAAQPRAGDACAIVYPLVAIFASPLLLLCDFTANLWHLRVARFMADVGARRRFVPLDDEAALSA